MTCAPVVGTMIPMIITDSKRKISGGIETCQLGEIPCLSQFQPAQSGLEIIDPVVAPPNDLHDEYPWRHA